MDNPMLVVIGIIIVIGLLVFLVNSIRKKNEPEEEVVEQTEEEIAKDYVDSILVKTEIKEEKEEENE